MNWITEYQKSLKNVHAEEPLDVYFFRPIAFVIVKLFYALPLTPNHYSLLAFISGSMAGYNFIKGSVAGFRWGAFYFCVFAVLDCCDGMVARLKKNGTEFGRMIDGLVDYSVNMIVYFSLAYGLKEASFSPAFPLWGLVILAGLSKAIHSISYDHYLTEYISYEKGDSGFVLKEIKELENKIEKAKADNSSWIKLLGLKMYLSYSKLQAGNEGKNLIYNREMYCLKNLHVLWLWSLIGPAVHIAVLILAFTFNYPNLLFFYAIVFGNVWLVLMYLYQFRINQQLSLERVEEMVR